MILAIFFIIFLVTLSYFLAKYAMKYYYEAVSLKGTVDKMEVQILLKNQKLSFHQEMKDDIFWAAKAKGKSEGYREVISHMNEVYQEGREQIRKIYDEAGVEISRAESYKMKAEKYKVHYGDVLRTNEIQKEQFLLLQKSVNRVTEERDEALRRNRVLTNKYNSQKELLESQNPSKTVVNGNATDFTTPPRQDDYDSDTPIRRIQDSPSTVFEYEDSKLFSFEEVFQKGYTGRVQIIRKSDRQVMNEFNPENLNEGIVHHFNSGIKIVLCALPGCYKIAFATQSNKKCCCRDHVNKLKNQSRYVAKEA